MERGFYLAARPRWTIRGKTFDVPFTNPHVFLPELPMGRFQKSLRRNVERDPSNPYYDGLVEYELRFINYEGREETAYANFNHPKNPLVSARVPGAATSLDLDRDNVRLVTRTGMERQLTFHRHGR